MTHAQMTSDEWVDAVLGDNVYTPPVIPAGAVIAHVKGGTYFATLDEVNSTLYKYYTPSGTKLRSLVIERSNSLDGLELTNKETIEFYQDATAFELAIILAWYDSVMNGA